MKALIIEDKEYIRKGLRNMLSLINADIEILGECESVSEAVIVTKACKPELVFLDINLTDGNAFDFLDQIETINFKIIFITAYEEYALRALKIGAVDYLLKPVDIDELETALNKIGSVSIVEQNKQLIKTKQAWNNDNDTLILSLQDSYQVLDLKKLMYCQSDKGYTTFYMENNKKYLASKSIKEFEQQLLDNSFSRPHQSFMVNLKFIDKYDKSGTIYLKNGVKIPVSSRKKDNFITRLFSR